MLKYVSILAPLILRKGSPNPVKTLTNYMGAILLGILAGLFFLAALFTWVATNYGLDLAFLTVGLSFMVLAIVLLTMAKISQARTLKLQSEREARIKGLLATRDDPLADHIPDELLAHPVSQKVLAQIEDKPLVASAAALGVGVLLSHQLMDATD